MNLEQGYGLVEIRTPKEVLYEEINYHRPCRWFYQVGTTAPDIVIRCCLSKVEVGLLSVDLLAAL